MAKKESAEVFPLHEFLIDELASRKWTPLDLNYHCSINAKRIGEILAGSRINLREAEQLAFALGVSATLLLNIQMAYRKYKGDRR